MTTNLSKGLLVVPEELSDLDKSIYLARFVAKGTNLLRPLIYKVFSENLWEGRFSSFSEYIESPEGLAMNQGYATRLRDVEKFYVIDNKIDPQELEGIDHLKLYALSKMTHFRDMKGNLIELTPESRISIARVNSRLEITQDQNEVDKHPFEQNLDCKKCGLLESQHGNN